MSRSQAPSHESPASAVRIILLGLGNLMRTDDAVGMLTTRLMEADPRMPANVTVIEGGTLGLDLLGLLDDGTHMLVLDAVDMEEEPGTLVTFAGADIAKLPTSKSVHLMGLSDLMNVMRLMDLPELETVLLGIQPEHTEWGTELTARVAATQPRLVDAAFEQIATWNATSAFALAEEPCALTAATDEHVTTSPYA